VANMHYAPTADTWTAVPGAPMAAACSGWGMLSVNLGSATGLQAAFNNGSGTWDNNAGKNYPLGSGMSKVDAGTVTSGVSPCSVDSVAPSVPAALAGTAVDANKVSLTWSASTDNVGVSGYYVYRNGALIATVASATAYTDSTAAPSTTYSYTLKAFDAAANVSGVSAAASVTTPPLAGNTATVYYKNSASWSTVNMHYAPTGGSWTVVPGVAMASACSGWTAKTVALGAATGLQVAFNNGAGTWDNRGGANYALGSGLSAVNAGAVSLVNPCSGDPVATCQVRFTTANANTVSGQSLRVVGDQAALGNWAAASGFGLTIQGSGANVPWSGTLTLPANTTVQYKYVKWNGTAATWESNQATPSGNREYTTPASCSSVIERNDGNFKP
jgi:hypothetical protein